ncbi:MAG: hypothetical protein WDN45_15615 [Caulobacteraceae bacterium]
MSRVLLASLAAVATALASVAQAQPKPEINPAPTARDWADIANLPDLSGVWLPKPLAPVNGVYLPADDLPPWNPAAARRVQRMLADDKAGHPQNIYIDCLPEGMPSFVLMTLNAVEFLVTPGRVTVLGEFDGNRLRRIWTDGRGHPEDPDLTFSGHSIGHWEGPVLVVDTVGFLPQVFIPIGQSVGVPSNGDLHVVERIRLTGPDTLQDDLQVIAPKILTRPWSFSRVFTRTRERRADVVEASCRQGDFTAETDADGFAVFRPLTREQGGAPVPPHP